jgi:hypothetical protein
MVPDVDTPSIEPRPEIRGPLISLLTQWYTGADKPTVGDSVALPDATAAIFDLWLMFLLYVQEAGEEYDNATLDAIVSMARMFVQYAKETENKHGADFQEFLRRQALEAFGQNGDPSAFP